MPLPLGGHAGGSPPSFLCPAALAAGFWICCLARGVVDFGMMHIEGFRPLRVSPIWCYTELWMFGIWFGLRPRPSPASSISVVSTDNSVGSKEMGLVDDGGISILPDNR